MDANIEKRKVIDKTDLFKDYMGKCKIDAAIINKKSRMLKKAIYTFLDELELLQARGTEYYYYDNNLKKIKVNDVVKLFTERNINLAVDINMHYEFKGLIESGAKYDIKELTEWKEGNRYKIFDKYVRRDGPGNMLYGYFAKCLGIRTTVMNLGAGGAQIWDNLIKPIIKKTDITYDPRWFRLSTYGDDPYDQLCIKWGGETYDKYH